MSEAMQRTTVVMVWMTLLATFLGFGVTKFYFVERTNYIKLSQQECLSTVGTMYDNGQAPAAVSTATTAQQVEAGQIECIVQYPIK
jgi:hypothetical protein